MIQVWQTKLENFAAGIVGEPVPFPGGYVHVANVFANEKEAAFLLTNTIFQGWWLNDGVESLVGPCRSTSVGDVLVYNNRAFRCTGTGWKEIQIPVTDEELRRLISSKALVAATLRKSREMCLSDAKAYVIKLRDEMGGR